MPYAWRLESPVVRKQFPMRGGGGAPDGDITKNAPPHAAAQGVTALHFAVAKTGNLDSVRVLLDHGAPVNAFGKQASSSSAMFCHSLAVVTTRPPPGRQLWDDKPATFPSAAILCARCPHDVALCRPSLRICGLLHPPLHLFSCL